MITKKEYLKALEVVKQYKSQCIDDLKEIEKVLLPDELKEKLLLDCNLSVRACNALSFALKKYLKKNIALTKVIELQNLYEYELVRCRNFGVTSLIEIKRLCEQAGIELKK